MRVSFAPFLQLFVSGLLFLLFDVVGCLNDQLSILLLHFEDSLLLGKMSLLLNLELLIDLVLLSGCLLESLALQLSLPLLVLLIGLELRLRVLEHVHDDTHL